MGQCLPSYIGTSLLSFCATRSNVTSRLKPELGLDLQKNAWPARCSTVTPPPHPVLHGGRGHPDCRPAFSQPKDLKEKPVFQGEVQGTTRQCLGHRSRMKHD